MIGGSGGLEALCVPRYLPENATDSVKLLVPASTCSSESTYGLPNPAAGAAAASHAAAPHGPFFPVNETSPLTRGALKSTTAASLVSKTLKNAAAEAERLRRFFVVTEKDIEQGAGACSAFSFLSVTVRKPLTPPKVAAVGYSFMPFLLFACTLLVALCTLAPLPLFVLGVQLCLTLLSELLFKKVVPQPRPPLSLVSSPGMPSSHCLVSFALLAWLLLEALVSTASLPARLLLACLSLAVFLPMPWARYFLEDHSEMQCFVGCLGGLLCGVFVFVFRHLAFPAASIL
ncbi:hypothetical protein ACSSS7_003166 [Eimeria intestinalis]